MKNWLKNFIVWGAITVISLGLMLAAAAMIRTILERYL